MWIKLIMPSLFHSSRVASLQKQQQTKHEQRDIIMWLEVVFIQDTLFVQLKVRDISIT